MREYDVTPEEQGSACIYQGECTFYKYGIWCNICKFNTDFAEWDMDD